MGHYEDDPSFENVGTIYRTYHPVKQDDHILYHAAEDIISHTTGLQAATEREWLDKYSVFRNWYDPFYYANTIQPWFLPGISIPKGFFQRLYKFWDDNISDDYKVLDPSDIKCPKADASSGLSFTSSGWIYGKSGVHWKEIQEGASMVMDMADYNEFQLAVSCPNVRLESGPDKPRVTWNWPKHLYILERCFMEPIQAQFVNKNYYIGKASNCLRAAMTIDGYVLYVGTHGDDWVAYYRGKWYMGDWSDWDLFITALQVMTSLKALKQVLMDRGLIDEAQAILFDKLMNANLDRQIIWPWAKTDKSDLIYAPSLRHIVGHVNSGGGWFVMVNNSLNHAGLKTIFEAFRKKSYTFTPKRFTDRASALFGWKMKPEQFGISPNSFISSRAYFSEDDGWLPSPLIGSLARNMARPNYDPGEFPNNTSLAQAARLRSLANVLSYSSDSVAFKFMEAIDKHCRSVGWDDPWGTSFSNAELALEMTKLSDLSQGTYGMDSFLST